MLRFSCRLRNKLAPARCEYDVRKKNSAISGAGFITNCNGAILYNNRISTECFSDISRSLVSIIANHVARGKGSADAAIYQDRNYCVYCRTNNLAVGSLWKVVLYVGLRTEYFLFSYCMWAFEGLEIHFNRSNTCNFVTVPRTGIVNP